MVTWAPTILCVKAAFPANDGKGFIDEIRKNPNKFTYGNDGLGGTLHQRIFVHDVVAERLHRGVGDAAPVSQRKSDTLVVVDLAHRHLHLHLAVVRRHHRPDVVLQPEAIGRHREVVRDDLVVRDLRRL